MAQRPPKPAPSLPAPAPVPQELSELLVPGRIRDLDDVSDVVTAMIRAFCEGQIDPRRSKEVRQWTHLLFTSVAAKNPKQESSVNLIAQLISMEQPLETGRTIIEMTPETPERPVLLTDYTPAMGLPPSADDLAPELLEIE
jgi:hypothetical protein